MSALRMIRLDPDMARVMQWGAHEGVTLPGGDDGYLWHAILKAAFGQHAPKPFRLVEPASGRTPYLVGYARSSEDQLHQHADSFADPAVVAALNLSTFVVKAMPEQFKPGLRLGFEVRVRPVVRQTRNGNRDSKREVDVFIREAKIGPEVPLDRETVYRKWLTARLQDGGAKLVEAKLLFARRTRIVRRDGSRNIQSHGLNGGGPDVCFRGDLTVVDPEAFQAMLARGVGRHRAFGFGMLLLRPLSD